LLVTPLLPSRIAMCFILGLPTPFPSLNAEAHFISILRCHTNHMTAPLFFPPEKGPKISHSSHHLPRAFSLHEISQIPPFAYPDSKWAGTRRLSTSSGLRPYPTHYPHIRNLPSVSFSTLTSFFCPPTRKSACAHLHIASRSDHAPGSR